MQTQSNSEADCSSSNWTAKFMRTRQSSSEAADCSQPASQHEGAAYGWVLEDFFMVLFIHFRFTGRFAWHAWCVANPLATPGIYADLWLKGKFTCYPTPRANFVPTFSNSACPMVSLIRSVSPQTGGGKIGTTSNVTSCCLNKVLRRGGSAAAAALVGDLWSQQEESSSGSAGRARRRVRVIDCTILDRVVHTLRDLALVCR